MADTTTEFPPSGAPPNTCEMSWEVRVWRDGEWEILARASDRYHAIRVADALLNEPRADFAEIWGPGRGVAFGEWVVTDRISAMGGR